MSFLKLSVFGIILFFCHGFLDSSCDERIHTLIVSLGMFLDFCFLSAWESQVDPVIILLNVLVDGLLLIFANW